LRQIGLAFPGPERWSLAFDPGGNQLVVLYDNGTAMVWNVDPTTENSGPAPWPAAP